MVELLPQELETLIRKMQQVDNIEIYLHFPSVIIVGPFRLEEGELSYLLEEQLIVQSQVDSIGKVYSFTQKFKIMFG